eukprot:427987_1
MDNSSADMSRHSSSRSSCINQTSLINNNNNISQQILTRTIHSITSHTIHLIPSTPQHYITNNTLPNCITKRTSNGKHLHRHTHRNNNRNGIIQCPGCHKTFKKLFGLTRHLFDPIRNCNNGRIYYGPYQIAKNKS